MTSRGAGPADLRRVVALLTGALEQWDGLYACALPVPFAAGAVGAWPDYLPRVLGLGGRLRVFLEEQEGTIHSVALVYDSHRPEWVVLALAALGEPGGADSAFRLLSDVSAAAARSGMERVFAAVPTSTHAQEPFFQAGFYSYTRETWYVRTRESRQPAGAEHPDARSTAGVDAHELFRLYLASTPDAVQRAEQLTVADFDVTRRAGAYDPPHFIGGNPLAMRRASAVMVPGPSTARAFALGFAGINRHPNVLKVRTVAVDVDLARDLVRGTSALLPAGRALAAPVRSYEEHAARALLAEGFREAGAAMLFVKELAIRVEEPVLAPVVVR